MLKISKHIKNSFIAIFFASILIAFVPASNANAANVVDFYSACSLTSPIESCIMQINKDIMGGIIAVVVIISVFMLPYIVLTMTSGDPQKIQNGKDALFAWISGFLLIVFSGIIIIIVLREMLLVGK